MSRYSLPEPGKLIAPCVLAICGLEAGSPSGRLTYACVDGRGSQHLAERRSVYPRPPSRLGVLFYMVLYLSMMALGSLPVWRQEGILFARCGALLVVNACTHIGVDIIDTKQSRLKLERKSGDEPGSQGPSWLRQGFEGTTRRRKDLGVRRCPNVTLALPFKKDRRANVPRSGPRLRKAGFSGTWT